MVCGINSFDVAIQESKPLVHGIAGQDLGLSLTTQMRPTNVGEDVAEHPMMVRHVPEIVSMCVDIEQPVRH